MQLLSGRAAQKTKNESRKLTMYSKQWLPGDTLHVFYPIFWLDGKPELAVGAIWGHQVSDIKELGLKTRFIPSTTEFDVDGNPIGQPDITYQFSMIAKVFIDGRKAVEEAAIEAKKFPNESLRKEALKDLEYRYDTKTNQKAIQPIIKRPSYYISTEVISIKLANGVPDPNTIAHTSAPLSNDLLNALYSLMDNPKYAPQEGDKFFEVEWAYVADPDKTASGRKSKPAGLTPEFKMPTQFPEQYSRVESMMGNVSMDAQSIVRRATRTVDPNKVRAAVAQYSYMHSEDLDAANEDNVEILLRNAPLLKELSIPMVLSNEVLASKINLEIEKAAENAVPATPETLPEPNLTTTVPPAPEEATTQTEVQNTVSDDIASTDALLQQMVASGAAAQAGAPSLEQLISNQYNISGSTDVLDGIDNGLV